MAGPTLGRSSILGLRHGGIRTTVQPPGALSRSAPATFSSRLPFHSSADIAIHACDVAVFSREAFADPTRACQRNADRQRYKVIRTFFTGLGHVQSNHLDRLRGKIGLNSSAIAQLSHRSLSSSALQHEQGRSKPPSPSDGHEPSRDDPKDGLSPLQPTAQPAEPPPHAEQSTDLEKSPRPDRGLSGSSASGPREASEGTTAEKAYKYFQNYPRSLRELAMRAMPAASNSQVKPSKTEGETHDHQGQAPPHMSWSTRPSKEDLLRIAAGFWTRMRIRFKWFTIRGFRRFNADDISAFFTLGGLGTILFIFIGTTTFFSLIFAALNALNLQEWIARKIADYLTAETGVTVVFESAVVPKWKDSRISFKNVFISRRAHSDAEALRRERKVKMQEERQGKDGFRRVKRRTGITAGDGMAWEGTHYDEEEEVAPPMSDEATGQDHQEDDVNTNFTMFNLQVDSIDVNLSLSRWFDGRGLIEDAVIKGVRGIVDRRNVFWDPVKSYDPKAARRQPSHGDFELESLVIEDFLVSVYQPNDFRPFNFSIFSANIPKLRKQWLFYDLLSAEQITGQVDGCLFSLHKPQSISRTVEKEKEMIHSKWKSMSRLRIDGVNFDHIQNQSDLTGPVSWILSGKFDVVADIKFPRDFNEDMDINAIITEILDNLSAAVSGEPYRDEDDDQPIPGQHRLSGPAIEAPVTAVGATAERVRKESEAAKLHGKGKSPQFDEAQIHDEEKKPEDKLAIPPPAVVIEMDVRFKDVKAAVPLFTKDISYSTNAFVRPIVAFMNANKTLIPIHCRIVMDLSEFDGSLDMAQTGMLPVVSEKIYEALANHVASENASTKRLRNVSMWSLQVTANAALDLVTLLRDTLVRPSAPL